MIPEHWDEDEIEDALSRATRFEFTTGPGEPSIIVEARDQQDGNRLWCVKRLSQVLNRSSQWEWEPSPSNCSDDFLSRTRFDLDTAMHHACVEALKMRLVLLERMRDAKSRIKTEDGE